MKVILTFSRSWAVRLSKLLTLLHELVGSLLFLVFKNNIWRLTPPTYTEYSHSRRISMASNDMTIFFLVPLRRYPDAFAR
jgi:hypothetical protein